MRRSHVIFFNIKSRIDQGQSVNAYEQFHFCDSMWVAQMKGIDGYNIYDYDICGDYWFMWAYREYWDDLHFLMPHYYPLPIPGKLISKKEMKYHKAKLQEISDAWSDVLEKTNHSDKLLQEIATETRKELKKIRIESIEMYLGARAMKHKQHIATLRSKYIYLKTLEYINQYGLNKSISLADRRILFDENSIIHILNRHYEFSKKQSERTVKSFHSEDIFPFDIFNVIEKLFTLLKSRHLNKIENDKVYFKYKDKDYTLWVNAATIQRKGIGNIKIERISSFYPSTKIEEISDRKENYRLKDLDEDYGIYLKKTPH